MKFAPRSLSPLVLGLLGLSQAASAQTYYVDFGTVSTAGSTGNILNWSSATPNETRTLIDFATGLASGITISMSGAQFTAGTPDGPSTLATGQVGTYLSPAGMNLSASVNGDTGFTGLLTLSGLDFANFTYALTLTGIRNNGSGRTTYFTIGDVTSFSNVSSGSISTSAVANDRTLVIAGNNTTGTAARFVGINPGADNDLTITLTSDDTRWYLNAMNLTATPIPEPSAAAALVGVAGLGFAALRRRRRA